MEAAFIFHSLLFISLSQEINIILKLVCIFPIHVLYYIMYVFIHKNKMSHIMYQILLSDDSITQNCYSILVHGNGIYSF